MKIHVFDLDGTLVDSSHRYKTVQGKIDLEHWIKNSNKVLKDEPLPMAHLFRELLKDSNNFVVIATARVWCELSDLFLELHNLVPHALIARTEGDSTPGARLKLDGLKKLNLPDEAEYHIYEDNIEYLKTLMFELDGVGHYCPSNQGH